MLSLTYQHIEQHLLRALPELAVPHARYVDMDDSGPYIAFSDTLLCYLNILLALPTSPNRDTCLRRAFAFVEDMIQSGDRDVRDLAYITVFEGGDDWWLSRAMAFMGPASRADVAPFAPRWQQILEMHTEPDPEREIIDSYGVRDAAFEALQPHEMPISAIPGISSPRPWTRFASLEQAQAHADGVFMVSCHGTSHPHVVGPAASVACDELVLLHLAEDLADLDDQEPRQRATARSDCYVIPLNERVWRMRVGDNEHGRYDGTVWIAPEFVAVGLAEPIKRVLMGEADSVL
jgi:hypothetical protein